jgi:hypothetical protein
MWCAIGDSSLRCLCDVKFEWRPSSLPATFSGPWRPACFRSTSATTLNWSSFQGGRGVRSTRRLGPGDVSWSRQRRAFLFDDCNCCATPTHRDNSTSRCSDTIIHRPTITEIRPHRPSRGKSVNDQPLRAWRNTPRPLYRTTCIATPSRIGCLNILSCPTSCPIEVAASFRREGPAPAVASAPLSPTDGILGGSRRRRHDPPTRSPGARHPLSRNTTPAVSNTS